MYVHLIYLLTDIHKHFSLLISHIKKPKAEISLNVGSLETSFQINETEMHYHQAALWLNQKLSAEPTRLLKATGQCQWERRTNWAFRGASARWA